MMLKNHTLIIIFTVAILAVNLAIACQESYTPTENVLVYDVIETSGDGADCNISLYANNTLLSNNQMLNHGLAYSYDFGNLNETQYVSNIECNLSNASFLGECKFVVESEGENNMIAIIIGLGLFMLFLITLGVINFKFAHNKLSYVLAFISWGFVTIEIIYLMGLLYVNEAGADIIGLLRINFYIAAVIGFGIGMISLFLLVLQLISLEPKPEKW